MGLLLTYIGLFVPLRVSFITESTPLLIAFETIVDIFFAVDIVLNFFSAYEKNKVMEHRHKKIAEKYLKGWFLIDLVATIPFQLIEFAWDNAEDSKLLRFARLPRITRMVRILRLLKMFRIAKASK